MSGATGLRSGPDSLVRKGTHMPRLIHRLIRNRADAGMTTAEYAVGTLAAVAFAAVLLAVVKSGVVMSALTAIITGALNSAK